MRLSTLAFPLLLISVPPVSADIICQYQQVTDTTGSNGIAADYFAVSRGRRMLVFSSTADLISGQNTDGGREVFLFDVQTGVLSQITSTIPSQAAFNPSIDDRSKTISFVSSADLDPGQNPDEGGEAFVFDIEKSIIFQISQTPQNSHVWNATISGNGMSIVAEADADYTGSNSDRGGELFLFDVASGSVIQLTETLTAGGFNNSPIFPLASSSDGLKVVFSSDKQDIVPGGNPDRNTEIFVAHVASGNIDQITDTVNITIFEGNRSPAISGNGAALVFNSTFDLEVGMNPDRDEQVFLFEVSGGTFLQVTGGTQALSPAISDDGRRVAFKTGGRLTMWDQEAGVLDDNFVGGSLTLYGSVSGDGLVVPFAATFDPVGENADGNSELFLRRCSDQIFVDDFESGDTSVWSSVVP